MGPLSKMSIGQLSIIVGIVTAVAWVTVQGTTALVISIVGGGLIALRASSGDDNGQSGSLVDD